MTNQMKVMSQASSSLRRFASVVSRARHTGAYGWRTRGVARRSRGDRERRCDRARAPDEALRCRSRHRRRHALGPGRCSSPASADCGASGGASRTVLLDAEEFSSLPGVSELEREDGRISFRAQGDLDAVVKRAARHTVTDIELSHPTLEEVFLTYYGAGEAACSPR
jgi:hypothetical protein